MAVEGGGLCTKKIKYFDMTSPHTIFHVWIFWTAAQYISQVTSELKDVVDS